MLVLYQLLNACACLHSFWLNPRSLVSLLIGSCSQCWDRLCCCWASNCDVLWEAEHACEHSDWEMGAWPNRHQELPGNKGRSSSVLPGGKSVARKLTLCFFSWVRVACVPSAQDQSTKNWNSSPFVSKFRYCRGFYLFVLWAQFFVESW